MERNQPNERDQLNHAQSKLYLKSYRILARKVAGLEKDKQAIRADYLSTSGIQYSDMPHGSGGGSDLSDVYIRYTDRVDSLNEMLLAYRTQMQDIRWSINCLPSNQKAVLQALYTDERNYSKSRRAIVRELCEERGYGGKSVVYRIHDEALLKIERRGTLWTRLW